MQINWDSFKKHKQDSQGVRIKFENLCRQLFANENISENKHNRYLHANPQNPGLETEPVYDESRQIWIGFQAKFFDDKVDYCNIKDSAQKAVDYYAGKLNLVFLFCNRPLKTDSLSKTIEIFKKKNISLELITDEAILDLVRKYPYLGSYYFGNHTLDMKWIESHTNHMFDELGERYNRVFNVETESSIELSLFLHDEMAVRYINEKKNELKKKIETLYWRDDQNRDYLNALAEAVEVLPDVSVETLCDSIKWIDMVVEKVRRYYDEYELKCKELEYVKEKVHTRYTDLSQSQDDRERARKEYFELVQEISNLQELLDLPRKVEIGKKEQLLLQSDVMNLCGRAGSGKSQLLAHKTNTLLLENRITLLLLAGLYFSDAAIQEQIMSNLRLEFSFEELIDVLEAIGERDNRIVPILIDALNETWHNKLWKSGLPLIIDKVRQSPMVKLVFSYRPEYGKALLTESVLQAIDNSDIVTIIHRGFEDDSVTAVTDFLNHYNIPFAPQEYFSPEMTNPLFLTLYCKTYNGEEVSLSVLYERLIEKIGAKVYSALDLHSKGFCESDDILSPLLNQMADQMADNNHRGIAKTDLMKLSYWTEYGLAPALYVGQLVKEGLLHSYVFDGEEYYYFAYDQMNDYYIAKAILGAHTDKGEIRDYLIKHVLKIKDGKLGDAGNIDLFVNACALYADRNGEECIDIIDLLDDENDQYDVFSVYIRSFQWRNTNSINDTLVHNLLKKYPCSIDEFWRMLIGNSIKVFHPLNACFLHELLSGYELNERDYYWTIFRGFWHMCESPLASL